VKETTNDTLRWDANLQCKFLDIFFMTQYRKIIALTCFNIIVYVENVFNALKG